MVPTPSIEPTMGRAASTSRVVDTDRSLSAMSRMVTSVLGSPAFFATDLMASRIDLARVFRLVATLSQPHFGLSVRMKLTLPKVGTWSPPRLPKIQSLIVGVTNTLHWDVLHIIAKVLKCRCSKWPRMSHLDACCPSYGQKKSRESNW
jgi:hypothetical protein